jgi:hypothetical protein
MVPEERGSAEENMFMNEATFLPSFYEIVILWCQTERKCRENRFMNEATFLPSFLEIIILWHQTERKCGFLALNINQRVGSWLTHTQCLSADPTTGVGAEL